ncbi:MAG: tripartite tricarboxylate transporter TctB family protein [Casimicrobiaceae bacterium]
MEPEKQGLVSARTMEIAVGAMLFVLGMILIIDANRLGTGWGDDGPKSGYFPFYIGLILCFSAAVSVFQAVRAKNSGDDFVEKGQARLIMAVLIPTILYTIVIWLLGIYVASLLFITVFMLWQGKFSWLKSILISAMVVVALWLMFEVWFKVPLPKGPLEALFGY